MSCFENHHQVWWKHSCTSEITSLFKFSPTFYSVKFSLVFPESYISIIFTRLPTPPPPALKKRRKPTSHYCLQSAPLYYNHQFCKSHPPTDSMPFPLAPSTTFHAYTKAPRRSQFFVQFIELESAVSPLIIPPTECTAILGVLFLENEANSKPHCTTVLKMTTNSTVKRNKRVTSVRVRGFPAFCWRRSSSLIPRILRELQKKPHIYPK